MGSSLDAGEELVGAFPKLSGARLEVGEGVRRHLILELLELLGVGAREEAAHDREHLAELDEDAAELQHAGEQALAFFSSTRLRRASSHGGSTRPLSAAARPRPRRAGSLPSRGGFLPKTRARPIWTR
jgi:hypothetical protein